MNGVLGISFLHNSFEISNVLTKSHIFGYIPADDNLDNHFDVSNWIMEANELQALDFWVVKLSILKLLDDQK